jgi:hypothetical protein
LVRLQREYRAWLDNLPPNLESSALADRLQTIVELDLEDLAAVDPTWLRPRLTDSLLTAKAPYKPDPKACCIAPDCVIHGYGAHRKAKGDVDGGASSDLPAGGRWVSERSAECGVGAAGAADPQSVAGWATTQDRHAGGDERNSFPLRTDCPWRYLPRNSFPPRSTVYNIFRKFQRNGVWDAIWAELQMAVRERMGRQASPSAGVLDSQSLKSAKRGR